MKSKCPTNTYKDYLVCKYKRLVEDAYNLKFVDAGLSDILSFEALKIDQKIKFLRL